MARYQLAQLNVARLVAPLDSPELAGFVARLDEINALAEASPGFVWRFQTDEGDATSAEHPFGDDMIVNMSVWASIEALHAYVYRSAHAPVMARRKRWFRKTDEAYAVLWWVPAGHRPTVREAHARLLALRADGPSCEAFTFKRPWPAPGAADAATAPEPFDDPCPAT